MVRRAESLEVSLLRLALGSGRPVRAGLGRLPLVPSFRATRPDSHNQQPSYRLTQVSRVTAACTQHLVCSWQSATDDPP